MVLASLNRPNKTITIHKIHCSKVPAEVKKNINEAGNNGILTGSKDTQLWVRLDVLSINKIKTFFRGSDYGKNFCSYCFSPL